MDGACRKRTGFLHPDCRFTGRSAASDGGIWVEIPDDLADGIQRLGLTCPRAAGDDGYRLQDGGADGSALFVVKDKAAVSLIICQGLADRCRREGQAFPAGH